MTKFVNDTDRLTFILTNYGLERVAQALEDKDVVLMLTKIKVGDADYEYYEPDPNQTDLKHQLEDGEFYIIEKDLLEDNLTVSLHAVMPEDFDNCEIREVGIYENMNGVDKLFAISTQQPLLKPSVGLRYFISVDYFAFLKSANLAEIYDQIYLDPDNQMITQNDFDNLISTILFTESNLMEQINGNSRVLGLNRPQQLHDKIIENRDNFSYIAACNNYSLLLNNADTENVFSYWLFNYPRKSVSAVSITDIAKYGRNLYTNKGVNSYDSKSSGFMPMLTFTDEDYFYLPQNEGTSIFNPTIFTLIGNVTISADGTASNFSANNYITLPSITRVAGSTYAITFGFYLGTTAISQSIAFLSGYSFWAHFDASTSKFILNVGNGSTWKETLSFEVSEAHSYVVRVLFNDQSCSLDSLENGEFVEKDSVELSFTLPTNLGTLCLGKSHLSTNAFHDSMDLNKVSASKDGNILYTGSETNVTNSMSFLSANGTEDISFSMLFALKPEGSGKRTLLARSNYSTNSNIFEVSETENNALEIKLFSDSLNYLTFSSGMNSIPRTAHAIGFSYNAPEQKITAFLGGKKLSMSRVLTGDYSHMNNPVSTLYSFTYTETHEIYADRNSEPTELYKEDGSPYTGDIWAISEGNVFYEDNIASYNSSGNKTTSHLYSWVYNDGLDDFVIYTKSLLIDGDTILYNADYSQYVGTDFTVELSGEDYIIQYKGNITDHEPAKDIQPKTIYCFLYSYPMRTIWANSNNIPTVLYQSSGDVYNGDEWYVQNSNVYYKNGKMAVYNSLYNIKVPTLPVTSYVIGEDGKPQEPIDSSVGIISVTKEFIPDKNLRSLTLNLDAAIGNNPCVKEF